MAVTRYTSAWLLLLPAVWISIGTPPGEANVETPSRYDLRPGDHLIYRQTIVEDTDLGIPYGLAGAPPVPFERSRRSVVRASWTTHLTVVDSGPDGLTIGIQRNRDSVEVERWEVGGEELGADGARQWLSYAAPPELERFADATRIAGDGTLVGPPAAAREWPSKALWDVRELPALPPDPALSGAWQSGGGLPWSWGASSAREIGGEQCREVEGMLTESRILVRHAALPDTVRMRYSWCPESGLVQHVEFEGTWRGPVFQKISQRITIELSGRSRKEGLDGWIADPDVRLGTLQALALADRPPPAATVRSVWSAGDAETLVRALALPLKFGSPVPDSATLDRLAEHEDPRVRTLAARVAGLHGDRRALERAARDPDYFVRGAARQAPGPPADDPAGTDAVPCEDPATWLPVAEAARREPWRGPGTRLHRLETGGLAGVPYAVYVPFDYTGEEPFPVLVYLSGNDGPVMEGVLLARAAAEKSGYLVVYPDGGGFWWTRDAAERVEATLEAVLRDFNVDSNRIYLSGLSNGGAGAYYLGALWPHRWTAVVSAMGGGHFVPIESPADAPIPSNAAQVPFLFLHGERDVTISPETSLRTAELMRPHRATLETHFFPDRGHAITIGRGDDDRTIEFLQRHESRPVPRSLSFALRTLRWPRHYWIQVLEKDSGLARIQGTVQPDGSVRLVSENVRRARLLIHPDLLPNPASLRIVANGAEVYSGGVRLDCETLERTWRETGDARLAWAASVEVEIPGGGGP